MKFCKECKQTKEHNQYYKDAFDRPKTICIECTKAKSLARVRMIREKQKQEKQNEQRI